MVSKFIVNGKILQDLILPPKEKDESTPISGMLSYDGKTLQFLDCRTMEVRLTQKVKAVNREKALFKSKNFREVERLGYDNYLIVITGDSIVFYKGEETEENKVLVEIGGRNLV